jgi:hypothetical protein
LICLSVRSSTGAAFLIVTHTYVLNFEKVGRLIEVIADVLTYRRPAVSHSTVTQRKRILLIISLPTHSGAFR